MQLGLVGSLQSLQSLVANDLAGPEVHAVEDIQVPVTHPQGEVTVRMYIPEGPGPFPVHFNMHGGELFSLSCFGKLTH